MKLRKGGDGYDWFLLALARWRKGENETARTWFDKAVIWAKQGSPNEPSLRHLWSEAAALLGKPGPDKVVPPATR